jgi:hypothetical protein
VITGEQSPPFPHNAAQAAAQTLPNGRLAVLPARAMTSTPAPSRRSWPSFSPASLRGPPGAASRMALPTLAPAGPG